MSWFLVGGAAIGAGVGSYGHDNYGWSKDAIWQGAAVGAGAGYGAGAMAGAGGTAGAGTAVAGTGGMAATPTMGTLATSGVGFGGVAGTGAAATAAGTGITAGQMAGYGMLGASALSTFAGGSSSGQAPSEKINLTGPGEDLYSNLQKTTENKRKSVESGDIGNLASQYIPGMLKSEGQANRAGQMALTGRLGSLGDKNKKRGQVQGGSTAKQALAKSGARVDGLRAPGEWIGANIKEQYGNVQGMQGNLMNLEQQSPRLNYQANLARNSADLANRSSQGSAYANLARMGGMMTVMNKTT